MNLSIKAKSFLATFLYLTGTVICKLKKYSNNKFLILMYHRIIPSKEKSRAMQSGMIVEPQTFELHIRFLKKYFDILPLYNLISFQRNIQTHRGNHKCLCALTFDDGWYDFYKYAYPILRLYEVPATVFLPTDFIGTNKWFWTDRLGFILDFIDRSLNDKNKIRALFFKNSILNHIVHISGNYESRLEKAVAFMKNYRIDEIEHALSELSNFIGFEPPVQQRVFLSWDEVLEMASSGLISFGSHTAGHPILTTLTQVEAQQELKKSMNTLISKKLSDPKFISFCYPNGDFTDNLCEMVHEMGYNFAVTTQSGWNCWDANLYKLKRVAIHQDMTSTEAMFGSRIVNIL